MAGNNRKVWNSNNSKDFNKDKAIFILIFLILNTELRISARKQGAEVLTSQTAQEEVEHLRYTEQSGNELLLEE